MAEQGAVNAQSAGSSPALAACPLPAAVGLTKATLSQPGESVILVA